MAHKVSTGEALRTGFFQTRNFSERRLVWGWWHWASRFLLHQEPWAYVRFDSRVALFGPDTSAGLAFAIVVHMYNISLPAFWEHKLWLRMETR